MSHRNIFACHHFDARKLDEIVKKPIADVIITSPPYYNLKDYGYKEQIGYGQEYDEYLNDLKTVFAKCYDVTKKTGSLWIVIDTFKKNGKLKLLPFDLAQKLDEVGWQLNEIIIWKKNKTLPWSGKGQFRRIFEYVLFFTKSQNYKFYIDRVREPHNSDKIYKAYPERYNPKGRVPTEVWEYPIPQQGAWGNGYIRHFCPFPRELVGRIILLTTNKNDIVMDPFAGAGTVLFEAAAMNRRHIGFELNEGYIKMFKGYLKANLIKESQNCAKKAKKTSFKRFQSKRNIEQLKKLKQKSWWNANDYRRAKIRKTI